MYTIVRCVSRPQISKRRSETLRGKPRGTLGYGKENAKGNAMGTLVYAKGNAKGDAKVRW